MSLDADMGVLVCMEWGQQSGHIPCTKRPCFGCGKDLAPSTANIARVERDGIAFSCMDCALKVAEEVAADKSEPLGVRAMVNGKEMTVPVGLKTIKTMMNDFKERNQKNEG